MVFISSRTFSKGGGVGRRELCLRTGEQQRQAYYLRGGVLIIDNFAHSSRAAAIICFAFVTTLQDRPPASMSIRNVVSSVFRTALSAFCLLHPLQYPVHNPRGCHSSHPQLHLRPRGRRKAPALGLVSLSSRISAQAPRVHAFATWSTKEVVSVVRCRQHPALQLVVVPRERS